MHKRGQTTIGSKEEGRKRTEGEQKRTNKGKKGQMREGENRI